MSRKCYVAATLLAVLALVLSACGVVDTYNDLIDFYNHARREASSFRLCVDTAMGTIFVQAGLVQQYNTADIEKAKVWRQALDRSGARLIDALKNYKDVNGNPIPVDKLDLAALMQADALPNGLGGGLTLMVNAFTEAPLPQLSDAPTLAAMRTASEQLNKVNGCGEDWNSAVEKYNTRRSQVPGDIVGTLAQKLGVKELPASLPYYTGDYSGSISQPNLPPTPTTR